jgi:hypothetical protein
VRQGCVRVAWNITEGSLCGCRLQGYLGWGTCVDAWLRVHHLGHGPARLVIAAGRSENNERHEHDDERPYDEWSDFEWTKWSHLNYV